MAPVESLRVHMGKRKDKDEQRNPGEGIGQFALPLVQPPAKTSAPRIQAVPAGRYSNYVVYVDESGDRFNDRPEKESFISELTGIIEASKFILISCAIDKMRLRERELASSNPYHLALGFCLETLFEFVQEKRQDGLPTHVVVECRGKKEDKDLELEFLRICRGENRWGKTLPFHIAFADKKTNSSGLQLADLVARPIGLSLLRPNAQNRAFEVLKRKFFCKGGRQALGVDFEGWGHKIFPPPESEKPR